ncbi:MAG: hypothetical protein AB7Q01_02280 [Gammaproteobacteria bacterium]
MSNSERPDGTTADAEMTGQARKGIKKAEAGDAKGLKDLESARRSDPEGAEAAEQTEADGPGKRGLSR